MREVKTTLEIEAPTQTVWEHLIDKSQWRRFSDFSDLSPGRPICEGGVFTFGLRLLGLPPTPVRVRVIRFEPDRELRWVGKIPGFRGEHYFLLEGAGDGRTRLVHGECFSGLLGTTYDRLFHRATTETYAAFNVGLALRSERDPDVGI